MANLSSKRIILDGSLDKKVNETFIEVVADGHHGHYGFTWCGNCQYTLKDKKDYKSCPECNYLFTETKYDTGSSSGGSDF